MTRLLLAALVAVALAGPAFANAPQGPSVSHGPSEGDRMGAHHHPGHCTIRRHHRVCRR